MRLAIQRAVDTDCYLVAVFRFKDGVIDLDRVSNNFPRAEMDNAVNLLRVNLMEEMLKVHPKSSRSKQ